MFPWVKKEFKVSWNIVKYFSSIAAEKIGKKKCVQSFVKTNDWTHFFLIEHTFFANFYCSERWKVL